MSDRRDWLLCDLSGTPRLEDMTAQALPTSRPTMGLDQARAAFAPVPGYLNDASLGLPPRSVLADAPP